MSGGPNVTPFPSRPPRPRSPEPGGYEDDEPLEPFEPFYASQMEGREPPPRRWLIDGVAERGTVLLFSGAPKIGKSLLLQQLLTSVAIGKPWLGYHCEQARTLGIYGEDSQGEIERRQKCINDFVGCSPADYELDLAWKSMAGQQSHLVEFDRNNRMKLTPRWHQIKAFCRDQGTQVIGLDNARVLFGGNENWPLQVTSWARLLTQLAIDLDGVIVLAAHPGKNDPNGTAGTGAWLASVRAGMSLRRPDDWEFEKHGLHDPRRVLAGLGANNGPGVRTERIDWEDGVFALADPEERRREPQGPLSVDQRRDARYHLLVSIRRYLDNGGQVFADPANRRGLPALVRRSPTKDINRITIPDIELMQQEMLDAGQIERVDVGGKVLLRPADGPWYKDEQPWLPSRPPLAPIKEAAD